MKIYRNKREKKNKITHGYIYILSNRLDNSEYKIGHTTRDAENRISELNHKYKGEYAGSSVDFCFMFQQTTFDSHKAERLIHKELDSYRVAQGYELFIFNNKLELDNAKSIIKRICNKIDDEANENLAREHQAELDSQQEITGEAKRKELERQRIIEAEKRRIERKIEFAKKQALIDEQEKRANAQKEFEESMRRAEERRIEQIKNNEAAKKARELEEALKKNPNFSKDKIHVDDKKDSKAQSKIKNVYCTVCGKQNRVPSYENDKRPICGNCKSPLWSEINRKTYEIPIDKLSNSFQYSTNEITNDNFYAEPNNEDKWIKYVWIGVFSIFFLIWALNSGQETKQPVPIDKQAIAPRRKTAIPAPAESPVDNNLVQFRDDWKKIEAAKKVEEQKMSVSPTLHQKIQEKKALESRKKPHKLNKTKDLRYCLEIENVAAFNKCVNQ